MDDQYMMYNKNFYPQPTLDKKCERYWNESDYLPFETILNYWCGNNPRCREAKKYAIIAACERGEVQYGRSDDKNWPDPIQDLIGRNICMIHRESFERWANKIENSNKPDLPMSARSETTYLNIIGALLECVTGQFKDINFTSETMLREFIAEKFDDLRGLSPRTLGEKFSSAKKALNINPAPF